MDSDSPFGGQVGPDIQLRAFRGQAPAISLKAACVRSAEAYHEAAYPFTVICRPPCGP
jgi:hypothetical protein